MCWTISVISNVCNYAVCQGSSWAPSIKGQKILISPTLHEDNQRADVCVCVQVGNLWRQVENWVHVTNESNHSDQRRTEEEEGNTQTHLSRADRYSGHLMKSLTHARKMWIEQMATEQKSARVSETGLTLAWLWVRPTVGQKPNLYGTHVLQRDRSDHGTRCGKPGRLWRDLFPAGYTHCGDMLYDTRCLSLHGLIALISQALIITEVINS